MTTDATGGHAPSCRRSQLLVCAGRLARRWSARHAPAGDLGRGDVLRQRSDGKAVP